MSSSASARFTGRLALVTGGASGIGEAIARRLAAQGAEVVIADVDAQRGSTLARALGASFHATDVRDSAAVDALFASLQRPASLLVTSAGGAARRPALEIDDALLAQTLELNTAGFLRCAQRAARAAAARTSTASATSPLAIVHIASSLHGVAAPGLAHFAAAKAASVSLVRTLARELAPSGIRVNAVVPGPIETPMTAAVWNARPELREAARRAVPLGRLGEPADVAAAACWLLSDDARWVTGTLLTVDGGLGTGGAS